MLAYPQTEAIYVYGSYARGKETATSDIDICIYMSGDVMRYDFDLNDQISDTVGKQVHCVFCTELNEWCEKEIYNKNNN